MCRILTDPCKSNNKRGRPQVVHKTQAEAEDDLLPKDYVSRLIFRRNSDKLHATICQKIHNANLCFRRGEQVEAKKLWVSFLLFPADQLDIFYNNTPRIKQNKAKSALNHNLYRPRLRQYYCYEPCIMA